MAKANTVLLAHSDTGVGLVAAVAAATLLALPVEAVMVAGLVVVAAVVVRRSLALVRRVLVGVAATGS